MGGARTAASLIELFATMERRRELALRKAEQLPDGRVSLSYAISG